MSLRIGDRAPDFPPNPTQGAFSFTTSSVTRGACCSRIRRTSRRSARRSSVISRSSSRSSRKRNCKIVGLSVDPVTDHERWLKDIIAATGGNVTYPLIGDSDLAVAKLYDMLPADAGNTSRRPHGDEQCRPCARCISSGRTRSSRRCCMYPMSTGRNFDELLRLLDSCQLTAEFKVATPVNWKQGEDVIIVPAVSDEEARQRFPDGWKAITPTCEWCISRGIEP